MKEKGAGQKDEGGGGGETETEEREDWMMHSDKYGGKEVDVSPKNHYIILCTTLLPWLQSHISLIILPSDTFT